MALVKLNATLGLTGTLPAVSGANLTNIDGGKVLQVVQGTFNTNTETTSTTYTDILSVNITPSATSSKVLISVNTPVRKINNDAGNTSAGLRILKDGSQLIEYVTYCSWHNNHDQYNQETPSFEYLDSPNTTSQITYKSQIKTMANPGRVSACHDTSTATLTLWEIKA